MNPGYLYLQTHSDHPDMVRFLISETLPSRIESPPLSIRYIARFNDTETARMHVQNALRRQLVDIDRYLYRVGLIQAIAVVAADNIRHEEIWIDAAVTQEARERIEVLVEERRYRQRRRDDIWQWIGTGALIFLLTGILGVF